MTVWDESGLETLVGAPSPECSGAFATMWRIGRGNRFDVPAAQSILADSSTRKTSKGRYMASIIPAALTRLRLEDERAGQ